MGIQGSERDRKKENSSENSVEFHHRCRRSRHLLSCAFGRRRAGQSARPRKQGGPLRSSPASSQWETQHVGRLGKVRRADVTDSHIPGYVKELPYTEWGKQQWESYD